MSLANSTVRRATVDDLPALRALWTENRVPGTDLDKRFMEFQVVESNAKIVGAIALQIAGMHGRLHDEVIAPGVNADEVRPRLWERLQSLARNHGLARLWTQESAPFWAQQGFAAPTDEVLNRLPSGFGNATTPWLTLQLRDETALSPTLEQEFALFKQASREESEAMMRRAKVFKVFALALAFIVFGVVCIGAFLFFTKRAKLRR